MSAEVTICSGASALLSSFGTGFLLHFLTNALARQQLKGDLWTRCRIPWTDVQNSRGLTLTTTLLERGESQFGRKRCQQTCPDCLEG